MYIKVPDNITSHGKEDSGHKLLVLGSNFGAAELVQVAKERGIYTIVTDYYDVSRSNAKIFADECWDISTTETELLADKCRATGVTAVTCGVSEFTSEMTFRLCDTLGLPKYCTWEAWSVARNKRKFKDLCLKHHVPVATDYVISDINDVKQTEGIEYPVVVKPIDCGGNLGVSFCNNLDELKVAYVKAQNVSEHKDTIICEKRLTGKGYMATYAIAEGEASLLNFFTWFNEPGEPTNVYSMEVSTSGLLDLYLEEINEGIKRVFKEAGFTDGFAWIELMTDNDEKLYVMEPGYRLAAGMIPYTYSYIRDFNTLDWYLDTFLGVNHKKEELPLEQNSEYKKYGISYMLWSRKSGTITRISGLEKLGDQYKEIIIDFSRRPGFEVKPFSVMGQIVFTAPNKEKAIEIIRYINDNVSVLDENGENILIHFTATDVIH